MEKQTRKSKPRVDLTGKKFGRLMPQYYIKGGKWHCRCECGKELDVRGASLRSGKTKSCGCTRVKKLINYNQTNNIIDLTNQKFGHLTVLGATEKRAEK